MSLARYHFQQHQAQETAEQAVAYGTMQHLNAYEQQLLQLNHDRLRLKNMQSDELRIAFKREQLPNYLPYVQGILAVKPNVQDEVITEIMVWAIDTQDFVLALDLAEYVLSAGLKLPDRFGRSEACFITESISENLLKQLKANGDVDMAILQRLEQLINNDDLPVATRDMPDEVKAKLYLALGRSSLKLDQPHQAQQYLERALNLHEHCGGKTDLNHALKHIKALEQSSDDMPVTAESS